VTDWRLVRTHSGSFVCQGLCREQQEMMLCLCAGMDASGILDHNLYYCIVTRFLAMGRR
jgi:hypothetical protein